MAKSSIKVRPKLKNGEAKIKLIIDHVMESGFRKDKAGKLIPANFVQEVICEHNSKTVLKAQLNGTIADKPYINFVFTGAKSGDTLKVSWVDNTGKSDSTEVNLK